jgi:Zn-dependent protease
MAWQDRPYYSDRPTSGNPLMWLVTGSVPLFTVFGIRVRAHASLILTVALVLLFGLGVGFTLHDRVVSMVALFIIVLLHEFGHCFTARWVGGSANDILMHPLGGLAMAEPPRRPLPTFLTIAGGPAVNVVICIICGTILWAIFGWVPWNPFRFRPIANFTHFLYLWGYVFWIYEMSLMLLVFNLLPIFPLDGGQMLQSILWPWVGYYKSMMFSCITGMVAAVVGAMVAISFGNVWLAVLAVMGFMTCLNLRRQLLAVGPYEFQDEVDYSAAYEPQTPRKKRAGERAVQRLRNKAIKEQKREHAVQARIDAILAKVSAHGMQSLNWLEKRALKQATERQRLSDAARRRKTM